MIAAAIVLAPALSGATVGQPAKPGQEQQALEAVAFAADFGLSVLNAYSVAGDGSYLLGSIGVAVGATTAIWAGSQDVRTDVGRAVMVTGAVASLTGVFSILRAVQAREPSDGRSAVPDISVGAVGKSPGIVLRWRL
ncbi:MAG: hypothetical protein OEO21_08550 [Candidatus Krumholzibacteria bacterium]|nr:hypothetical protein [Candidatus Krumholzibacteria bacterium]